MLWSGKFTKRNNESIREYSGYLCADIDKVPDRVQELIENACQDPHVVAAFISPSGTGVKIVFQVPVPADENGHKRNFAAVRGHVSNRYGAEVDEAAKDVARLCFVSHDPNAFYNAAATELEVRTEPEKPTDKRQISPNRDAGPVKEGNRNNATFKFACECRDKGMTLEEAMEAACDFAARCEPPFDEKEAETCVRSAYSREPRSRNGLRDEYLGSAEQSELPFVILPSGDVTISACAEKLFNLIAPTKKLFVRGGAVMTLVKRDDGLLALEIMRPSAARSFFEKFARLMAWRQAEGNRPVLKPVNCPQDMADALLQSEEAAALLPRVQGLINCPVLREVGGMLSVAGVGYDEHTQLLVTGGGAPSEVSLEQAVEDLLALFAEFDFQTPGDQARAIASLITVGLKTGGFLKGRVPADVAEADQSQSGKTYRQKIIAAVYNEKVSLVTSRTGGVGSTDESLNQQLIAGRPFIQFDNFRGRFDSAHLEAFLTAEGSFPCRVPHRGEVTVQPENYFIFLTSNGVDTTRDLANRSNIIRILKKPPGFAYTKYEEGDLLSRVRHWQPYYLGCVFAVIREWYAQGKPTTGETRHDFREWVQIVDWICQHIFRTVPVMDGHQQAQQRVSNPAQVWLRSLALAVNETGELNRPLTATDINAICESADITIPGLRPGSDDDKAKKVIGMVMAKLFREGNVVEVDQFLVNRNETSVARGDSSSGGSFKSKTYTVTKK